MKAEDIIITPEGRSGPQYRSIHDARPTAPNGTLWRVSKVEGETVHLYAYNGWGRFLEETCRLDQLFLYESGASTPWEPMTLSAETNTYLRGTHAAWSRIFEGAHIFTVRPKGEKPGNNDGGYVSISAALSAKGMS